MMLDSGVVRIYAKCFAGGYKEVGWRQSMKKSKVLKLGFKRGFGNANLFCASRNGLCRQFQTQSKAFRGTVKGLLKYGWTLKQSQFTQYQLAGTRVFILLDKHLLSNSMS